MENSILVVKNFSLWYGQTQILKNISMNITQNTVVAIMGPSGCGKSSLIRSFNRMNEMIPNVHTEGEMFLDKESILSMDPIRLRRKVGMVFQQPNPFPTMSIYENVIAGYILNNISLQKDEKDNIVKTSLERAALWEEVKNKLHERGSFLSGGQQQRLCIARTLAMNPQVLLLDEPTSALDPRSTAMIEELIVELKSMVTIVVVTHNIAQAGRVADYTAFMHLGELIEYDTTKKMFTLPKEKRTEEYLTGKFG